MVERWPLTGRTEELRVISEAIAGTEHSGVVIAGPAGVGKTRLARSAIAEAARAGCAVHRIAGTATGRSVTMGAFARWTDAVDESPLALARKVFANLATEAADAPVVLFVDDAHLLDDLSALIVHQLALQNSARVIATIRTGEIAPDAVTALWKDGLLTRLELQSLSHDETGALLSTVLGGRVAAACTERMWTLSRGNVLFLNHLVDAEVRADRLTFHGDEWRWTGTPSVSPTLVELVETQIGNVPDAIREVVELVAIGEPLERSVLTAIVAGDALEDAEERGLITVTGDAVFTGHPLYGEIRLGRIGPLRLRRLRGRVAHAMSQDPTCDPLRLGLLWRDSDLPPNADVLTLAAGIAVSRLNIGLAEELARSAVAADPSATTKLLLAYTLYLQERGEAAQEQLDSLSPTELAAPGFVDGVTVRAANLLFPLRDPQGARAVLADAIALGDDERLPSLLTFRGVAEVMAAEPEQTIATMAAVDYGRLDPVGAVIGYASETIALGDLGRVTLAGERAAEGYRVLLESSRESFHGTNLHEFHAYALAAAGYLEDAVTVAERWYREYVGFPGHARAMAASTRGMAALFRGDLVQALRHLHSAREGFGDYGKVAGEVYRHRFLTAEVNAHLGDHDAAVESLAEARTLRHPSWRYVESGLLLANAWVAAGSGRATEARELASGAAEFAREHAQWAREVLALQTAVQFGDHSGADRLTELAARVEGPRAPLAARYAAALAADDGGALDAVSHDFETLGDALAAADAAAQASTSHRAAGRRGSALSSSARAYLIANSCGGAVSPALTAARVPLPFTRREHEIATLLSEGLTNRDIAAATSLSIRTVEGHIYQASTKAGVTSRSELSALVRQFHTLGAAQRG
jgi:DNA-binding NarL/FixJ family response regulator